MWNILITVPPGREWCAYFTDEDIDVYLKWHAQGGAEPACKAGLPCTLEPAVLEQSVISDLER